MGISQAMVRATKNGQTREFGQVQWKRLKENTDGTHEGWREVPSDTPMGEPVLYTPPEIAMPEIKAPAPVVTESPVSEFADINGSGNDPIQDTELPQVDATPAPAPKATKAKPGPKPKVK